MTRCHVTGPQAAASRRLWQAELQAIIADLAPRLAALPVVAAAPRGLARAEASDQAEAAAQAIIRDLRRTRAARISLGGNRQRIRMAGIDVQTRAGTANLLRLWLATARARLER